MIKIHHFNIKKSLYISICLVILAILINLGSGGGGGNGSGNNDPPHNPVPGEKVTSLTKDGVTWYFENPVDFGIFVTGDYYIIGPAGITSIAPAPTNGRNGSVLNLPIDSGISGFDDRVTQNRFREELRIYPPFQMNSGDTLISSMSVDEAGTNKNWLRESDSSNSPVKTISILTCLSKRVPDDSFRPSYCDRSQKMYRLSQINMDRLPKLPRVSSTPEISEFAEHFRRPWLDVCFFGFDAAVDYQACYGREFGRATGMSALLLLCDFSDEEKHDLLVGFIQYGIDLWGIAQAGYSGWPAHGGHGSGRKLPIVLAGLLLQDTEMSHPTQTLPDLKFGEDLQTMYDSGWTGASVVYAGHMGVWNN